MENKQSICDSLTAAINKTRAGNDIGYLRYDDEAEVVCVYFGRNTSPSKEINVSGDSGWAMIKDIVNHLDIG